MPRTFSGNLLKYSGDQAPKPKALASEAEELKVFSACLDVALRARDNKRR